MGENKKTRPSASSDINSFSLEHLFKKIFSEEMMSMLMMLLLLPLLLLPLLPLLLFFEVVDDASRDSVAF